MTEATITPMERGVSIMPLARVDNPWIAVA